MQKNPQETLDHMEAMLRRCRRRIRMALVSMHLREGLVVHMKGLIGIAGLFFVLRVLLYAVNTPVAIDWAHAAAAAVALGAVVFGRALWLGLLTAPVPLAGAAERLDLSQETHNRIATAISLLRAGDDSPFARAAIDDGFDRLERLQGQRPHVDPSAAPWRKMGVLLVMSVALVLAGQFVKAAPHFSKSNGAVAHVPTLLAKADSILLPGGPDRKIEPTQRPARGDDREPAGNKSPRDNDPGIRDTDKRAEPGKDSGSEGPVGQHASGKSRSSQSSSDSRSAATGAGVKSKPGKAEPGVTKKSRSVRRQTKTPPNIDQENKYGGAINARGSSGTGSMRTAQNEWSSEVTAKAGDNDDFEQEEEPDEDMDQDKQRLGMQPTLKNRTSQVRRELSLSMGLDVSNDMMKGRGGPNAQKKSRGTATMIMGVPVPGFVRGRMLSGPTKSTQEEVEPTPRQGDYALASKLPGARPEESPQEGYHPTAAMSVQARDYLIKYHAEHEQSRNGAATNE